MPAGHYMTFQKLGSKIQIIQSNKKTNSDLKTKNKKVKKCNLSYNVSHYKYYLTTTLLLWVSIYECNYYSCYQSMPHLHCLQ